MENQTKKVLFIATVVKAHINTFHLPYIKFFKDRGYETHVGAKNDFYDEECIIPNCDVHHNIEFERSPINKKNIKAYRQLKKIINKNNYEIIHCNTPVAAMLTRFAARKSRKNGTRVIYTGHGFHFFKGAPLINWVIYYPVEKICSYLTDDLITINKEDYELAKTKMKAKNIHYVPGVGVDTRKYGQIDVDVDRKRRELNIPTNSTVLLSVGELNKNKNHEVIIRALSKLNNSNIHYIIAGRGKLEEYLMNLSKELGVEKQVHLLGFRSDIVELCKISDIFCFPSYREGLSLSLMEAMACELPVVCSNIRGNVDLIQDKKGGCLCDVKSINQFSESIEKLINDIDNRKLMGEYNKNYIKKFDVDVVRNEMTLIYENLRS
ncbi:glycosyltransferase family 4 protein [Paraclostridium bifermentans]|uniref:glycosyltransferase family 4 protein n=1 Tax=Paraclostridium bifermentans TaxID=1490 RepID=UPI00359C26F3